MAIAEDKIKDVVEEKKQSSGFPVRQMSLPGQATTLKTNVCCNCSIPIRSFHITWITFFWCYFAWFSTTNIFTTLTDDFGLTLPAQQLALSLSITSNILFCILVAKLCPKYGSRVSYIVVLLSTMLSLAALASVQSSAAYIICHILLGIAGASFVVTQYHTTGLFAKRIVGAAQAVTAGFGVFGAGVSNFIAPLVVYGLGQSWRWFLIAVVIILFLLCFVYFFGTKDNAQAEASVSLINLSTSKPIRMDRGTNRDHDISVGGFFADAFFDYRTWVLFACYGACCGVELTFYVVAAQYFQDEFGLNEIKSGVIVMIWSAINLFARPFGGYLCDKYNIPQRSYILFILLFLEAIFLILFGAIGRLSLTASIVSSMLFSVCIQMAEGALFSIVTFVQPKSVGHVIGIVAAGGNFGATVFIFVIFVPWNYSRYAAQYSWVVVGLVVMICSMCALMIQFTNRELHDSNANMAACYDLEAIQTRNKIDISPDKNKNHAFSKLKLGNISETD